MFRKMRDLRGFSIGARDGDIGEADDFIFDDNNWTVRYLVADAHRWLPGRKLLISPIVVEKADWVGKRLPVLLTREEVRNSPDISMDEELSAQDEVKYYDHYGFPYYWAGGQVWGQAPLPRELIAEGIARRHALTEAVNRSHLRSMKNVVGYSIQATDGEIGHVDDFVIDEDPWTIRYMIVNTRNWLPGRKTLIAPPWISRVDWKNSNVYVNLSRQAIKTGPEFNSERLDREYEIQLYKHYGHETYW